MTDITKVTDQCVIRWGAGVSSEARALLLAQIAKLGKAKRQRALTPPDYSKARELAEGRGLRTIMAPDSDPESPGRQWIVRIYYRSMGGETLVCETGPISSAAASALERDSVTSDALGTDKYRA